MCSSDLNTRYTIILTVSEIIADNPIIDPDKAYFIYFENNGSLGCDTWANIKSKNKVSDIAFFKFGSVVGFTRPSLTFSVIFNPTSYSYSTWTSVPNSDKNGITHTVSNGLGDPCKLVSIPLASIKSGTKIDNGIWRIPTNNENNSFISKKTPSSFGISDMILGYRDYNNDGAASDVNDFGYWWSSTTHSATDGYCVQFTTSKLETKAGGKYRYNNGYIVRCVAK